MLQPGASEFGGGRDLTAVDLLTEMYYTRRSLDPMNVSLQSSFICMLHLANEKGLKFEQDLAVQESAEISLEK